MSENIEVIFNNNIDRLLGKSRPNKIGLAISGGADSVTLLILAVKWANSHNISLTVFSVDHNLRPEAKEEINYVRELSYKLGCSFVPLSLNLSSKKGNFQALARQRRYRLMQEACKAQNIKELLTAHHLDDFIENYLIRQDRASGILGLSSGYCYYYKNIRVLRPLFNLHKSQLLTYLLNNNIKWYEDLSNNSDKYQRNRIRKELATMDNAEINRLEKDMLVINEKAALLTSEFIKAVAEICSFNNYGFAIIDIGSFNNLTEELKLQVLAHVITIISGNNMIPRYRNSNILLKKISGNQTIKNTIHNCIIQTVNNNKLLIYKELSSISPELIPLTPNMIWDNRFELENLEQITGKLWVSALTMTEYQAIKDQINLEPLKKLSYNNHKKILFTLPIIKNLEKIIAIPHISYYNSELIMPLKVLFKPNFVSRFTHFL